jgi:hypothetical protein
MLRLWCGSASRSDVRPKSCFGAGHGRSNVQVDFPRARGADRVDSGQRFDPGGRLSGWAAAGFMAEVSAAGSTAAALAGGVEAASAAGAAVTAGEGGVGARVAGAVAAGPMPDGAIRGGGWAIRMAMAMTMGRDGVPITRATATATPRLRWRPLLLGPWQSLDAARRTRPLPRAAAGQRLPIGRLSAGRQLRILSFLRLGKAVEHRSD